MNTRAFILIIYLAFLSNISSAVGKFSLEKYMGHWYEIYSIPNRFEKGCFNVTADYKLNAKNKVDVKNTCRDEKGKIRKDVKGEAEVKNIDQKLLKVYFFRPAGLNIWGGDYQILEIDPSYKWALVGEPSKKYGWILSRSKNLSESQLKVIKKSITDNGYDFANFNKTRTLK